MNLKDKSILVTGGAGFLGSYVVDALTRRNVDQGKILAPRSHEMDLRVWDNCIKAVKGRNLVIHIAGRGGGIGYNQMYPGSTFFDNAVMGIQLMEAARREGVTKFVTIGTVCSYPKFTPIPFREEDLWNGYPEETNAAYGLSKKMLLAQGQAFRQEFGFNSIHLLLVNLYGPHDNFNLESSHVIPALVRRFTEAVASGDTEVKLWGSGKVSREFLYVEDAAEGVVLATERYDKPEPINLGSGNEITIRDLAQLISELTGFSGKATWDTSKPDGQPQRRLDVSKAKAQLGFEARTDFRRGLERTVKWYIANKNRILSPNLKQREED